ncbi:LOW QUALITY PROTEIN: probable pleckstrin homology domain-containing family N member 1 [Lampris incognitus]|uniref:LOW QUALITY PROTEIN: probable pleckstrin homology domain-containing family N member 1 n=1 Tax=Lampris incognitus TaxID=2546036 RepID=UPI0024B54E4E|nr:LOW QUALITY PROTEIN: probable pleckstrin homology domain-containing family N member 1 [Lampris incognitus]
MGSSMSCVPQHNFRFSSKSFIRRNSSRLFRKKNPQEGQEKSNSIINILCTVTPRKEMSHKDLQTIENIKWDPPFPYDPASGWKKSSINVKNYGRMIHSSKVRFRFLHCQDVHDCYLTDLFQTHLHFVSNNTTGLTYQGTLPLKELTICNLQQNCNHSQPQEFAFQINGVSLNPIIVYCASQEEMDQWFGLLKENIEANGGNATAHESYTRVKANQEEIPEGREELRNSINKEPIYEWEGSQRDSLGVITYVTKVRLQHLPSQERSDRLLVMYPATLIILSEENNGLFYKGKLPLNMISVTTPCQDVKPNTFKIEGKLINPIVVSCLDETEFCDWIQHFKAADVPVLSPPPPVYDIIYTPTQREAPRFDRWSGNSQGLSESSKLSQSQSGRGSYNLQFPRHEENPLSPGYAEPLCYSSSRPPSVETARLGSRSNSVSSHTRPERDLRPLSLRYSSPQRNSYLLPSEGPVLSQIYSTPYSALHRASPQHVEKAPLIKSNSWGTTQTSFSYSLNAPQHHPDMCAPRQPLSPLYDEPCTPDMYAQEEQSANRSLQQSWHGWVQQGPQLLPSSFQLRTPPMGRRCRRSLVLTNTQGQALGHEMESPQSQADQRAEAVSRLKLLPAPNPVQEQRLIPSSTVMNTSQMPYGYSPDHHSYLEPTEPDDQEMDYDNIWEYDCNTGMIQPMSGISPHRTGLDFGARGLGAMATQQRWS